MTWVLKGLVDTEVHVVRLSPCRAVDDLKCFERADSGRLPLLLILHQMRAPVQTGSKQLILLD